MGDISSFKASLRGGNKLSKRGIGKVDAVNTVYCVSDLDTMNKGSLPMLKKCSQRIGISPINKSGKI
jgi:hypothetical protein